jgi:hypothetical protein
MHKFLRTAVLLYRESGTTATPHPISWYRTYFLDFAQGIAGFWMDLSNTDIFINGDVFDWAVLPTPDYKSRVDIALKAMGDASTNARVNFSRYECVCVVVARDGGVFSDGGSASVSFDGRQYGVVVGPVGATFDFWAHEFGHQIGLDHSYGDPSFKVEFGAPGEYGHLYCIMSAQSYGGANPTFTAAGPPAPDEEYKRQGPSLCGATMQAQGWAVAHSYDLASGIRSEFDINSLGISLGAPNSPRMVGLQAPNGNAFIVEFRNNTDRWDRGLPAPLVCISQTEGSTAEKAHPKVGAATFLGEIRLPLAIGSSSSVYNGPGLSVEVLERPAPSQVRVRVGPGRRMARQVSFDVQIETLRSEVVETGSHNFKKGERECVEGTFPWSRLRVNQSAVATVRYPDARLFAVNWKVEDQVLVGTHGAINVLSTSGYVSPVPRGHHEGRNLTLTYAVEALPDGSRLRLFNDPADGLYAFIIAFEYVSSIGSFRSERLQVFEGEVLEWGGTYTGDLTSCLIKLAEFNRRHEQVRVVLPADLWGPMGQKEREQVQILLDAYGAVKLQRDRAFIRGLIGKFVGRADVRLIVVPTKAQKLHPPRIREHNDPPPSVRPSSSRKSAAPMQRPRRSRKSKVN